DYNAQHGASQHGQEHRRPAGQPQIGHGTEGDVSAYHNDITMGKIKHLSNAVNHGITQGDNGVHASQADPADQVGKEFHKVAPLFSFSFRSSMTEIGAANPSLSLFP